MSRLSSVAEVDELRAELVGRLQEELGDAVLASHVIAGKDLWVRVRSDAWSAAGEAALGRLGCEYFCFLSGIDWLPSPFGRGEDDPTQPPPERTTQIKQGFGGGDTRFQVFARVHNVNPRAVGIGHFFGLTLKADVPDDSLTMPSWVPVYAGANWHERETWEMFGIRFAGHPDLRHLYLPGDFEGHPLRKDFPLLSRIVKPWPGIVDVEPMPAELDADGGDEG